MAIDSVGGGQVNKVRLQRRPARPPIPSILLANVQSLDNKLGKLQCRISFQRDMKDCCVLCFTETRLGPNTPHRAIQPECFSVHRMDQLTIRCRLQHFLILLPLLLLDFWRLLRAPAMCVSTLSAPANILTIHIHTIEFHWLCHWLSSTLYFLTIHSCEERTGGLNCIGISKEISPACC